MDYYLYQDYFQKINIRRISIKIRCPFALSQTDTLSDRDEMYVPAIPIGQNP